MRRIKVKLRLDPMNRFIQGIIATFIIILFVSCQMHHEFDNDISQIEIFNEFAIIESILKCDTLRIREYELGTIKWMTFESGECEIQLSRKSLKHLNEIPPIERFLYNELVRGDSCFLCVSNDTLLMYWRRQPRPDGLVGQGVVIRQEDQQFSVSCHFEHPDSVAQLIKWFDVCRNKYSIVNCRTIAAEEIDSFRRLN